MFRFVRGVCPQLFGVFFVAVSFFLLRLELNMLRFFFTFLAIDAIGYSGAFGFFF